MRRKGFTLIELLVVVGLIATMLVIGAATFSAYLSETSIRLGARTVSGAFRAARQTAVSQRVITAVVFIIPLTDDAAHRVEIRRYDVVRHPATHTLIFALRENPDEAFELPGRLAFKWVPADVEVYINVDTDGDGTPDVDMMRLIDFFPDGSSSFAGKTEEVDNVGAACPANHVAVVDYATG